MPLSQLTADADGIGNNADADDDNDGVPDSLDAFPLDASETIDTDLDGTGDHADSDDDGDGVADSADAFPSNQSCWAELTLTATVILTIAMMIV